MTTDALPLLPQPRSLTLGEGTFSLNTDTVIGLPSSTNVAGHRAQGAVPLVAVAHRVGAVAVGHADDPGASSGATIFCASQHVRGARWVGPRASWNGDSRS